MLSYERKKIEHWFSTSQANGLFDVFPGGGTKGGEEDLTAFLCP